MHKWITRAGNAEGLLEAARENGTDVYHRLCEVSHMGMEIESKLARIADEILDSIGGVQ